MNTVKQGSNSMKLIQRNLEMKVTKIKNNSNSNSNNNNKHNITAKSDNEI